MLQHLIYEWENEGLIGGVIRGNAGIQRVLGENWEIYQQKNAYVRMWKNQ